MVKHLQIISGISYSAYWISNYVFELIKYYFTVGICMAIMQGFDKFPNYLWALYIVYGPSMVSFTYFMSFFFTEESSAQNTTIFINFLVGALGGTVFFVIRVLEDFSDIAIYLSYVLRIVPLYSFSYSYNVLLG